MAELRDVDLNLLLLFQHLLEDRNLSAVARRMDLSQPAVSNALRRLRAAFGDELFVRTGQGMLQDGTTLCATCWMHGVFAAQLTIGNTSFHKLFSVSRDPYNITRSSGLRMLIDGGGGWQQLAVPSAFEIGLSEAGQAS